MNVIEARRPGVRLVVAGVALAAMFVALMGLAGGPSDRAFLTAWFLLMAACALVARRGGGRFVALFTAASALAGVGYGLYLLPSYPDQVVRRKALEALPAMRTLAVPTLVGAAASAGVGFVVASSLAGFFGGRRAWLAASGCALAAIVGSAFLGARLAAEAPKSRELPPPLGHGDYRQYEAVDVAARKRGAGPNAEYKSIKDLSYGPNRPDHALDLYLPKGVPGPFPVVIWIHGGGWAAGSKDTPDDGFPKTFLIPLLARGYAVASINYRLAVDNPARRSAAAFPAQLHDAKAAVRFLRAKASDYGLDPAQIGVMGHSAGGTLAALLAVTGGIPEFEGQGDRPVVSSRVQAAVTVAGVTDVRVYHEQLTSHARCLNLPSADYLVFTPPGMAPMTGLSLGCSAAEFPALAAKASPTLFASADDPPMLIIQGFRDQLVPIYQAEYLHCELRRKGVDSTLLLVPGANHGGPELFNEEIGNGKGDGSN
jgi:acetyl esterase/lipase